MTPAHVALIASPWHPCPPAGYGGAELVTALLARGLRQQGLRVTLLAAEGSMPGTCQLAPAAWGREFGSGWLHEVRGATYTALVLNELERLTDVDLVHDSTGWASTLVASTYHRTAPPVLHTVHGPLDEARRTLYQATAHRALLVAVSHSQRRSAPELPWVGTVHDAVDVDSLISGARSDKEGYLVSLGRISPRRAQHLAIEVARRAGRRLILAGRVGGDAGDAEYFAAEVGPLIDGDRVVHHQDLSVVDKARLLSRADGLLLPGGEVDPFHLAAAEAMASGTPVLAVAAGSATEIVVHGATGWVVGSIDEMVEAVGWLVDIDPAECARRARAAFDPDAMVEGYLQLYASVLEGEVELVGAGTGVELADAVETGRPDSA